jgi:hypothetical protein
MTKFLEVRSKYERKLFEWKRERFLLKEESWGFLSGKRCRRLEQPLGGILCVLRRSLNAFFSHPADTHLDIPHMLATSHLQLGLPTPCSPH